MRFTIEVENRKEGELIRKGLENKATRATVKVMGALADLKSDRARARVLNYVHDKIAEEDGR